MFDDYFKQLADSGHLCECARIYALDEHSESSGPGILHVHEFWELRCSSEINRSRQLNSINIDIIPPNIRHRQVASPLSSNNPHALHVSIMGGRLVIISCEHNFFWQDAMMLDMINTQFRHDLEQILRSLYDDYRSGERKLLFFNTLSWLFAAIADLFLRRLEMPDRKPALEQQVLSYIHSFYYDHELSVGSIAEHFNFNGNYLSTLFRQRTGQTLNSAIREVRLSRAYEILHCGRYSVKETAELSGWNCQFYFSNCFRKRFGVSPSEIKGSGPGKMDKDNYL